MSRPIKQGLDYFPHDTDAMNDEKLEVMQLLYGNDGYAFYFKMLERIYRSASLTLDISDAETKLVMIRKCQVDEERFDKMVNTALRQGLFDIETFETTGEITSKGVFKRSETVMRKRESMRGRYSSKVSDAETMEETMPETPQSKVKESKVKQIKKESKEQKTLYGACVYLFESEYQSLVKTHGQAFADDCVKKLDSYKASSGKQYESDYHAIQNWVVKRVVEDINKPTPAPAPKPTYTAPVTQKPKMVMATQEHTQYGITDEEMQEMLANARKLDEGSPKDE